MAAKKKARRKARTFYVGLYRDYPSQVDECPTQCRLRIGRGCPGDIEIIRVREILPRTPAKRKGGRR